MASELQTRILQALDASSTSQITSEEAFPDVDPTVLRGAVDSLSSKEMVAYETKEQEYFVLTAEGKEIADTGSHEAKVYEAVAKQLEGLKISELPKVVGPATARNGQGKAIKEGWIKKDKDSFIKNVDSITDTTQAALQKIQETGTCSDKAIVTELKKRKMINPQKRVTYTVKKGPRFQLEVIKEYTDLDVDMLQSGAWEKATFKPYNLQALGAPPASGALHPLMKVRNEFRQIFFEMGFTEMPTNQFVESGFWNFDTLFVPQQHPARDLQDTFYVSDPAKADPPRDVETGQTLDQYWENVRAVHQDGAFGSLGYRYPWEPEEALRLVLRTHTTSVSAAMLYQLAKNPKPVRLFSIDRVFRNETVDATHLAEFHQIEGVIADFDLTLGDLIGFLNEFFAKMGVTKLRFKPTYNPYTEPSMEVYSWHDGLNKWVEIGNSGMFRPEMLEAMGLPRGMRAHGFGLGLERPTMIKYGVSNIRELLGHKVNLNFIESNPAVRLDKNIAP